MKKQAFGKKLFLNRETLTALDSMRAAGGAVVSGSYPTYCSCAPTCDGTCTTLTSNNSNCGRNTQPLCE